MWSLYFFKWFSSENYSDDFEDEDIDVPLTKDEETDYKENSKSEKINAPTQVYINYIFDSFEILSPYLLSFEEL